MLGVALPACGDGGGGGGGAALPPPFVWTAQNPDNVALSAALGQQNAHRIVSDGNGGAVVVWADTRSGASDIYAQRVSSAGVPLWTADGVPVCVASGIQNSPRLVADGLGGAILVWVDARAANQDIYAQRLNALGQPQWTADGVAICLAAGDQRGVDVAPDGAGGGILSWTDGRGANDDIYARRVDAAGTPLWTTDGVAVCAAGDAQQACVLATDGGGGAILAWVDGRRGSGARDVYAQRLDSAGTPLWVADGVLIGAEPDVTLRLASDESGGAIVAWTQPQPPGPGHPDWDIKAQRVDGTGALLWTVGGVEVCGAIDVQWMQALISDGAGGAFVAWSDYRTDTNDDVYAQRLNAAGTPQWALDGVPVCVVAGNQLNVDMALDGAGGVFLAWTDPRATLDIYAQRLDGAGAPLWTIGGRAVSSAVGSQSFARMVSDGAGGVVIAWQDDRSGTFDIYAQGVGPDGPP